MEKEIGRRTVTRKEVNGYYRTIEQLKAETGFSSQHIRNMIAGIKEQIQLGRYSRYAVLDGGELRVNVYVYNDYDKYRKLLANRIQQKYVPPFNASEMAEICPVRETVIVVQESSIQSIG